MATEQLSDTDVWGFHLFRCVRLHANLTQSSCAKMHLERGYPCETCATGALHASAVGLRRMAPVRDLGRPCCRCNQNALRLVGMRLCKSCYNREREWRCGANAKGTKPTIRLIRANAFVVGLTDVTATPHGLEVQQHGAIEHRVSFLVLNENETRQTILRLFPEARLQRIDLVSITAPGESRIC